MKVLIIEDEYLAAEKLEAQLKRYDSSIEIADTIDSVKGAVKWFNQHNCPDLVFLDIHLSDGNSFEIFKKVQVKCPVNFTTAYDEYAVKAFKVNSVDYLLKPFTFEELAASIDKYKSLNPGQAQPQSAFNMENLVALLHQEQHKYKNRFLVKSGQKIRSVPVEEIAYFYAEDKIVFLLTFDNHRYISDFTLDTLQHMLDPDSFCRINRQFIVHIDSIDEVHAYLKGRLKVYLKPDIDKEVVISNERAASFKEWLGK
ncbi:MAG: LytTR family DNA-binding domain-containing protein [Hymenobacteraceae bacterium]|nr:LytTR family DNA-binding domain-containing protein [Hymenobacteraceae bacterium]